MEVIGQIQVPAALPAWKEPLGLEFPIIQTVAQRYAVELTRPLSLVSILAIIQTLLSSPIIGY